MLLSHTNNCGQVFHSSSRSNLEGHLLSRMGSPYTLLEEMFQKSWLFNGGAGLILYKVIDCQSQFLGCCVNLAVLDKLSVLSCIGSLIRDFACHILTSARFYQEMLFFTSSKCLSLGSMSQADLSILQKQCNPHLYQSIITFANKVVRAVLLPLKQSILLHLNICINKHRNSYTYSILFNS